MCGYAAIAGTITRYVVLTSTLSAGDPKLELSAATVSTGGKEPLGAGGFNMICGSAKVTGFWIWVLEFGCASTNFVAAISTPGASGALGAKAVGVSRLTSTVRAE